MTVLRVIRRTHYQADEPAYLHVLVDMCTSPTSSDYTERVADRLASRLNALGREINVPAAKYCVDLARALKLVTENNFWEPSAHTLQLLASDRRGDTVLRLELSIEERIFWFRVFLEYDGAALVFLTQEALDLEKIPADGTDWNDVANKMMEYVISAYLKVLQNVQDRTELRQLLAKRIREPYKGKSGAHQCFVHVNTMARIGLLGSNGREYRRPAEVGMGSTATRFARAIPTVGDLEAVISKRDWPLLARNVFWGEDSKAAAWSDETILAESHDLYARVMATGVSLCALSTIIEAIQIRQLAQAASPISYDDCMRVYRREQTRNPRKLRFHVDRIGRPAFVIFS